MELNIAFGQALKQVRNSKCLTQEDFSAVSSRTYLSTLERGLKSPTLEKVDQLAEVLEVHPLTVLVATYLNKENSQDVESLLNKISVELRSVSPS
ncbi:helix-turn-helix domain-containing protein [Pseudomonas yamanorum]